MRAFLLLGSIAILSIGVFVMKTGLDELKTRKEGRLVPVVLRSVPRGKGEAELFYDGHIYRKQVGRTFHQDHNIGDTITLRHIPGSEYFYFDTEDGSFTLVLAGIGLATGLICLVKGIRGT